MLKWCLLALALLTAFWGTSEIEAQTDDAELEIITVAGRITSGTADAELPDDLTVRFVSIAISADGISGLELERVEVPVDANGGFIFRDVEFAGDSCRIVVLADFYTPSQDLNPCESTDELEFMVWDITDSLEQVTLQSYGIILPVISRADRTLLFLAFATVINKSDRIWVPDIADPALTGLDLLRFNLPEGFFELNVEEGVPLGVNEGLVQTISSGFALTTPIPPNQEYTLLISYGVPYTGTVFEWPLRLPHGADIVQISIPENLSTLSGEGLNFIDTTELNEDDAGVGTYKIYRGTNYAPGSAINLVISDLPQPTLLNEIGNFLTTTGFIWAISVTIALIFVVIVVLAIRRRRKHTWTDEDWTLE